MEETTQIQRFYARKSVFVTGGSGFLGKLVLEKLLRSCQDVEKIYVLLRPKKGKSIDERLKTMCEDVVFEKLLEINPDFHKKIHPIAGDIMLENFDMRKSDRKLLEENVEIFFHVAASVLFDEPLSKSVQSNLKGVMEAVKLAKNMKKLKAFVHVSTLYSNCVSPTMKEIINPPPMDYKKLLTLLSILPEEAIVQITPRLLNDFPNTYSYTKAVAEDMIRQECTNLPTAIFRPAIVTSTYKEPHRGWIDNLYGPTGVTAAAANGLLHCLHADRYANANLVPADMCANGLIAVGWEIGSFDQTKATNNTTSNATTKEEIPVYNFDSYRDAPIIWQRYMELTEKYAMDFYSQNAVWIYWFILIRNRFLYNIAFFLLHTIPSFLMDAALFISRNPCKMMAMTKKIQKFSNVLSYFSTRQWVVESYRIQKLVQNMEEKDRDIFFCDLKKLDWDDYFKDYFRGIRIYLIKDPMNTLEFALKRIRKFYIAHCLLKIIAGTIGSYIIFFIIYKVYCFF